MKTNKMNFKTSNLKTTNLKHLPLYRILYKTLHHPICLLYKSASTKSILTRGYLSQTYVRFLYLILSLKKFNIAKRTQI